MTDAPNRDALEHEADALARFRNWRGFLFAALVVNALFVYGMLGAVQDHGSSAWIKALSWLPFNVIATVLYLAFMAKLTSGAQGIFYAVLCVAMIVANWTVMFSAG